MLLTKDIGGHLIHIPCPSSGYDVNSTHSKQSDYDRGMHQVLSGPQLIQILPRCHLGRFQSARSRSHPVELAYEPADPHPRKPAYTGLGACGYRGQTGGWLAMEQTGELLAC